MPKKFASENSKAVVARARKAAIKEAEAIKKQQAIEDEYWRDEDKHVLRKMQRKEGKEKKRQEQLDRKAEKKVIVEQEMSSISTSKVQPSLKITRSQIEMTKKNIEKLSLKPNEEKTHLSFPLEENINRVLVEGESARNIDEAINILRISPNDTGSKSEKSLKTAFAEFEEENMPRIKEENPTLRLSQLKQILRKEWMRSTANPLNQKLNMSQ